MRSIAVAAVIASAVLSVAIYTKPEPRYALVAAGGGQSGVYLFDSRTGDMEYCQAGSPCALVRSGPSYKR